MKANIVALLRPPRGVDVRKLTAFVLLGVAIPRLPFYQGPPVVYPLGLLPGEVFGWMALFVGLGLLMTANKWRLRAVGRFMALLAFVLWITLAAATTSVTSMLLDAIFAYAMFGEIIAYQDGC